MAVMKGFLVFILIFLPACFSKPFNTSRTLDPEKTNEIKKEKLFLEDHLKGVKLERDGHVNKDYHHEAFLGKMVENGTLLFDNMDGYRRLIDLFHQVDKDGDHLISRPEMIEWIHGKIKEHVQEARENNRRKFKEADKNGDSVVTWNEFQEKLKELNATRKIEVEKELDDVGEPQDPIVEYHDKFRRGDLNMDDKLDETEFLYFEHPEHNPQSIKDLVEDMIQNFDKNQDKVLTKEEFAQLPPGEVDTQQDADLDEDYRKEREDEFVAMDEDGDGVVTVDELTKYLDPTHKQRAINEGNYLVSMADRNRDDQLSEKEVLMNYQLFTGSTMANYAGYLHDEF